MTNPNLLVLPCVPVADFPDSPPEDLTGAIKMICESCEQEVWLGPKKQKLARDYLGEHMILCFKCLGEKLDAQTLYEDLVASGIPDAQARAQADSTPSIISLPIISK